MKPTVSRVLEDLTFKTSDQNWSCPEAALLAVRAFCFKLKVLKYSKACSLHNTLIPGIPQAKLPLSQCHLSKKDILYGSLRDWRKSRVNYELLWSNVTFSSTTCQPKDSINLWKKNHKNDWITNKLYIFINHCLQYLLPDFEATETSPVGRWPA